MKKENIQSRNRKLSAKSRKKHNSFAADMLKPFEKMYGYGMGSAMTGSMSAAAAGAAAGMTGMHASSYYMPPHHQSTSAASNPMHAHAAQFGSYANPFAAGATSFSGMVSIVFL